MRLNLNLNDTFKRFLNTSLKAFKQLHKNKGYKPEDLKKEKAYQNLIKGTYDILNLGIKDNDMPEKMQRALQSDAFLFGGLKANAQLFEASQLLLNEDGTIKPYKELAGEFDRLNVLYNQTYLEAEYQFAINSSEMAAKWSELGTSERYSLQYRTADDTRVRDTHKSLHNVTLPKEDPFWNSFYPPNGWRCRCTVVEVLKDKYEASESDKSIKAGEKATTEIGKDGKNRLEIFRFNPGKEQKLMPPKHPYNKVKGVKEIKSIIDRYDGVGFKSIKTKNNGELQIYTSGKQNPQEEKKNKKAFEILANNGGRYRMLPVIEDGKKNPDGINLKTNHLVDVKVSESTNGKNIAQSSLKEASNQGAQEVIIHLKYRPDSYRLMYGAVLNTFKQGRSKNLKMITIIFPDNKVKYYNTDVFKKKKV